MTNLDIRAIIRRAMARKGLSIEQAASGVCTRQNLHRQLSAGFNPRLKTLIALCDKLDLAIYVKEK